jgi:hypothetical protein
MAAISGLDPFVVLSQGHEDYIISLALINKIMSFENERKIDEIKALSELIGYKVAEVIAKIF